MEVLGRGPQGQVLVSLTPEEWGAIELGQKALQGLEVQWRDHVGVGWQIAWREGESVEPLFLALYRWTAVMFQVNGLTEQCEDLRQLLLGPVGTPTTTGEE